MEKKKKKKTPTTGRARANHETRFTVTFPEAQAAALKHEAEDATRSEEVPVSISTVIRRAVSHYLAYLDGEEWKRGGQEVKS